MRNKHENLIIWLKLTFSRVWKNFTKTTQHSLHQLDEHKMATKDHHQIHKSQTWSHELCEHKEHDDKRKLEKGFHELAHDVYNLTCEKWENFLEISDIARGYCNETTFVSSLESLDITLGPYNYSYSSGIARIT